MSKRLSILSIFLVLLLSASFFYTGCNKKDSGTNSQITDIKTNGSLAFLPGDKTKMQGTLIVLDQNGSPVSGVTSSNVSTTMNWTSPSPSVHGSVTGTVTITSNSGTSGKPVGAVTTMDYSGSMGSTQLSCMESGVKTYISKMGTSDQTEILKFDQQIIIAQTLTSNKTLLNAAVDQQYSLGGSTALYLSIMTGMADVNTLSSSAFTRCVVAFTDGFDNASQGKTIDSVINYSLQTAIPVFTIFLYPDTSNTGYTSLKRIADNTGGFLFWAKPDSTCNGSLTNVYNTISGQISNSYSMNVAWPSSGLPPAGTSIQVTVTTNYSGHTSSFTKSYIIQ